MLAHVAAAQPLLIGALLLWSSATKLTGPRVAANARRTALPSLVGERHATTAYRSVGVIEVLIGTALLLPPGWAVDTLAAVALAIGFTGYLIYAKVVVPEASCGCVGSAATPVGSRSIARAGLLLAVSVLALSNNDGWWPAATGRPAVLLVLLVLLVEAMVFVALSPELDFHWLVPLRALRVRLTHPLAGSVRDETPLAATQRQLLLSPAYRSVDGLLRSDIQDYWDEDGWRFLSYAARFDGRAATAVFAVPQGSREPERVKVAVVDEASGQTVYRPVLNHQPLTVVETPA
jgi:hypothetical protein